MYVSMMILSYVVFFCGLLLLVVFLVIIFRKIFYSFKSNNLLNELFLFCEI